MAKSAISFAALMMVLPCKAEGAYVFAVLLMEADGRKWKDYLGR
jgi:hypothetical protein